MVTRVLGAPTLVPTSNAGSRRSGATGEVARPLGCRHATTGCDTRQLVSARVQVLDFRLSPLDSMLVQQSREARLGRPLWREAVIRGVRSVAVALMALSLLAVPASALAAVKIQRIASPGPEPNPATVLRRLPLDLPFKDGGGRLLRVEGADASERVTTQPQVLCPGMRLTAVGITWRQVGPGRVLANVAAGESAPVYRQPVLLEDDLDRPSPNSSRYDPTRRATELLWVGDARCIKVALHLPAASRISDVEAVFLNTSGTAAGGQPAGEALEDLVGPAVAQARPLRPALITRAQWGADPGLLNCEPSYAKSLKMAFVHHTAGSNDYGMDESDDIVRAIYTYHTQVRGYCDIAYNFLVDKYGQVFVGRKGGPTRPVIPEGHTGFNRGSTMISAIGNYQNVRPPWVMLRAIKYTLAWRLDAAHIPPKGTVTMTSEGGPGTRYERGTVVELRTISGHRDTGYTACPGRYLYRRLDAIRRAVHNIGRPKIFYPRQSTREFTAGKGSVTWRARASDEITWDVRVFDSAGDVRRSWTRFGLRLELSWRGLSDTEDAVPPGEYRVHIAGRLDSEPATGVWFRVRVT